MTKDELLEKYRDVNVDHEWWNWTYETFVEDMKKVGILIDPDDITFEGFYHQGSHASFQCTMSRDLTPLFMESHGLAKRYPAIYELGKQGGMYITKFRSVEIGAEDWTHYDICEDEDMNTYYQTQNQEEVELTIREFEEDVEKIIDDYEDYLYKTLRDEYEWLSSDEAVWEAIEANEWDEQLDEFINRGLKIGGHYA